MGILWHQQLNRQQIHKHLATSHLWKSTYFINYWHWGLKISKQRLNQFLSLSLSWFLSFCFICFEAYDLLHIYTENHHPFLVIHSNICFPPVNSLYLWQPSVVSLYLLCTRFRESLQFLRWYGCDDTCALRFQSASLYLSAFYNKQHGARPCLSTWECVFSSECLLPYPTMDGLILCISQDQVN